VPVRTNPVAQQRLPLIVTGDADLLDDLLQVAAAGNSEVRVAPDAVAAMADWSRAPFVLLGIDLAAECARVGLVARPAVILESAVSVASDVRFGVPHCPDRSLG
jgi:hypothetical protein